MHQQHRTGPLYKHHTKEINHAYAEMKTTLLLCFQCSFLQFQHIITHLRYNWISMLSQTNCGWNGTISGISKPLLPLLLFPHKPLVNISISYKLFRRKHQVHLTTQNICSHCQPSWYKQEILKGSGQTLHPIRQMQSGPIRQMG